MPVWLDLLLCVVVPPAWGVVMFYVFEAIDRRRRRRAANASPGDGPAEPPHADFSI